MSDAGKLSDVVDGCAEVGGPTALGELRVVIAGPFAPQIAAHSEICRALRREFQDALRFTLEQWGCEDANTYSIEIEAARPVVVAGRLSNCEVWREVK